MARREHDDVRSGVQAFELAVGLGQQPDHRAGSARAAHRDLRIKLLSRGPIADDDHLVRDAHREQLSRHRGEREHTLLESFKPPGVDDPQRARLKRRALDQRCGAGRAVGNVSDCNAAGPGCLCERA